MHLSNVTPQPSSRHEGLSTPITDVSQCRRIFVPQQNVSPEVDKTVEASSTAVTEDRLETGVGQLMSVKVARRPVMFTTANTGMLLV